MKSRQWLPLVSVAPFFGYTAALAVIALVSLALNTVVGDGRLSDVLMFYLVAVLFIVIVLGRGPGLISSVASFFALDWFFIDPGNRYSINDPMEWAALLTFAGVIAGQAISDQHRHKRELQEQERRQREAAEAEILRRTDELRTALLHAVSHDLRTPLSTIIAGAESLLEEDVKWTEDDRREFAQSIYTEARRLNRIVGNILDLSRIEAGSLCPQKEWHDLAALVDDAVGRLRLLLAAHPVAVDVPENLPPVELDYVQIDQVLSNLLENAARHTPEGTPITVSARLEKEEVRVEVRDEGPGIPPEVLPRLFRPFSRVEMPGARPASVGLGLAIARGLVEAHGGRIWVQSRPGRGACFTFTLPLSVAAEVSSRDGASLPLAVKEAR